VNGILDSAGSSEGRCGVWPLREPAIFAPARAMDRIRFELGSPVKQAVRVRDGRVDASPLLSASAPVAERWERIRDR
jgi:hypothetical protein